MKLFKKIAFIMFSVLAIFGFTLTVKAEVEKPTSLVLHYYRYSGDYSNGWSFWVWQNAPINGAGASYSFDKDENGKIVTDDFGAVCTIDLTTSSLSGATRLGIIVRRGDWVEKDIDTDRFFEIDSTIEGGVVHRYLVQGDERIGKSIDDPLGPDNSDKVLSAFFSKTNEITFSSTKKVDASKIQVLANDEVISSIKVSGNKIILPSNVDFSKSYTVRISFDSGVSSYVATFDGLYDTEDFENNFYYDGDDLGCVVTETKTIFKLWAPISVSVKVNIYNTGTPKRLGGNDDKQTYDMVRGEKGVWSYEFDSSLHGKYYTYTVTNGNKTNEVVDPYAKSCGINGLRGMCVDFSKTNPDGFEYGKYASNISNPTDAIIYELHIRDLTSHSSWKGNNDYRGKLMGLTQRGTTYTGGGVTVTTGLDHIIELGVTHVQILPFYDHGIIDETKKNIFNWGYMPENYNCIEGSYSSDPYDGLARVKELKEVSKVFAQNNLNIIMDVVFNHTGKSADSNFNLIVPGYYHRLDSNGNYCNGSGCGNETASNRIMMRKFMVDSVKFWASEYNIAGFRFDLMGLHDVETMSLIYSELKKINKNILVYGEPWNAGSVQLPSNQTADKLNLKDIEGVGAFNDEIRDAIKGSVFNESEGGFIQGSTKYDIEKLKYGVVGGVSHNQVSKDSLSYSMYWHTSPTKTINYVSAHDNNTLYDKIMLTTSSKQRDLRVKMQQQANAIVLTSQGIPFLHAGVEMLRSKPLDGGYDHNSYESPDSVNQIRWDYKASTNSNSCFEYYKQMIQLRKNHPAFRMTEASDVNANLSFMYLDNSNVLAYRIQNSANGDSWKDILVIHANASKAVTSLVLPESNEAWNLVANSTQVGEDTIKSYNGGDTIKLTANETLILYSGKNAQPAKGCCSQASGVSILSYGLVFASSFTCYAIVRRKKLF